MKKFLLAGSMIAALFILSLSVAKAQVTFIPDNGGSPTSNGGPTSTTGNPTTTQAIQTTITQILDLYLNGQTTASFNFATIADLDNGITLPNAATFTFRSNLPWIVNVSAVNQAFFTGGDINTVMPSSLLLYKLNGGGGTFTPISQTATAVTARTNDQRHRQLWSRLSNEPTL